MPFAQGGYPRAGKEDFRREFPCDFISEAIDQTRGWFYSLLAISTMLFDREPYRHCIVLGLVCDEKGEKMSKSKGNYLDPNKILETKGADAMRWYFYSANQPWTSVRFYEDAITGAQRDFLLKLYNVYLFFVIYARIDGFDPSKGLASFPRLPRQIERAKGYRPVRDRSLLDRWILAELDSTVRASRAALDAYDIYGAAGRLSDLVESASNWYLRRSRSRFWRSGSDSDKLDAYWTLYEVLVETSKLLAPFTPFIAEEIWGNLVAGLWKDAPESVHLADYPLPQDSRVDEALTSSMALAREIVQLGRAARTAGKLRVRQPLSRLIVVLAESSRAAEVAEISGIIIDELNVKRLSFADTPGDYVSHELRPNYRALGPRFGAGVKAVAEALSKLETEPTRLKLLREGAISVSVNGKDERLSQEEIDVRVSALPHYTAAESPRCVVVLETDLTDALVLEGHARELVHHIQSMRKELDLDYQDRITVAALAEGEGAKLLKRVVDGHGAYLRSETLAVFIGAFQGTSSLPAGALTKPVNLGGLEVTVSIGKSGGRRP
jgi:isoleucyl-tRNA synthetase